MSSDQPESNAPADLMRERDEVLQSFSRGAKFTEQFASEYGKVRALVDELQRENEVLRARLAADDSLARLVSQIEILEAERKELLGRTQKAELAQGAFDARFVEVETQFSALANLYVASNQLHSKLTPRTVVRRIKEILAQLVGAESYTVYMLDATRQSLVPIATEGVPGALQGPIDATKSLVGKVLQSGENYVNDERPSNQTDFAQPIAVLPLRVDEQARAAIVIFGTLEQKTRFDETDFELFRLLGQHAATALVAAGLYEESGQRWPSLSAFRDLSVS